MASRAPVRWFWRDMRLVFVLLVWAAFGIGLLAYLDSSISFSLHRPAPAPPQAVADAELYTGSIVVVPSRGDRCWQMIRRPAHLYPIRQFKSLAPVSHHWLTLKASTA